MALRITDPKGYLTPQSNNMPWPNQIDPTGQWGPTRAPFQTSNPYMPYSQLSAAQRNPPLATPTVPTVPAVPVGQVAQTPQPGAANFWDMLRNLFSGQQSPPQGQGMTGLLTPRGQAGAGTDALGNPFNRFG